MEDSELIHRATQAQPEPNEGFIWFHSKNVEDANPEHTEKNLNIRDFASINELAVLSNLETANAELVKQEISKEIGLNS